MKRALASLGVIAPMLFLTVPAIHADGCALNDGFASLAAAIPDQVGACVENEYGQPNGNVVQHTTGGLLTWSPSNNLPEFTDGAQTWVLGPDGVQVRPNDQRFPYEGPQSQVAGTTVLPGTPSGNVVGYVTSLINADGVNHPVSTSASLH